MERQSLPSENVPPARSGGLFPSVNVHRLSAERFSPAPSPKFAPPPARVRGEVDEAEVKRFVTVLRGFDESALDAYVSSAIRRGISPARFLLELVAPAAREIGEEWEADRCDFVDVTLASGRLKRIVRQLGASMARPSPAPGGSAGAAVPLALLLSPAGQGHTLGLLMVAEFLHADRWSVSLGSPFERISAPEFVSSHFTHMVGLSLSDADQAEKVRDEVRRIRRRSRNPSVGILVGGPALIHCPELVDLVEADASAVDARLVPDVARSFL
jgi:methanogenic corrinoid protein MtbC1